MDTTAALRGIVAALLKVDANAIDDGFAIRVGRLKASIGGGILDAAMRREIGVSTPAAYSASTFGELRAAVIAAQGGAAVAEGTLETPGATVSPASTNGASSAPTAGAAMAASAPSGSAPVACGIDLELVENLPASDDYWEDAFYRTHFTRAEIAYCVGRPDPRQSLAARWCAKEALRKCDASYHALDGQAIEVCVADDGRPWLRTRRGDAWRPVAGSVSLTHTDTMAAAMVAIGGALPDGMLESAIAEANAPADDDA